MIKPSQYKIVKSGKVVELFEYEKPIFTGGTSKGGRNNNGQNKEKNRDDSLRRSRNRIRNLINANYMPARTSFLTLTFKENLQDYNQAINLYKQFVIRLSRRLYGSRSGLKYLTVPEIQKRGAWHFHTVLFDVPYIQHCELLKIWGHGSVNIKKIDNVTNVGAYVCKYLTKEMVNEKRKSYLIPRGLRQPEVYVSSDSAKFDDIATSLSPDEITYSCQYNTEYNGQIQYSQYNLDSL